MVSILADKKNWDCFRLGGMEDGTTPCLEVGMGVCM